MSTNLWGDFSELSPVRTPAAILKEQATFLTEATSGILRGAVSNITNTSFDPNFRYVLEIVAPALGDYRYTVVQITHEIDLYPVLLDSPALDRVVKCKDEKDFLVALSSVLTSKGIQKAIASLVSQSQV